jgi:hypothetical protein
VLGEIASAASSSKIMTRKASGFIRPVLSTILWNTVADGK